MFSIVIPLYNKEFSIQQTINSVLNQSFQNFEVLVINDGSTDNSAEIVKRIDDSRIRLINQNNQGVSAARNRGITESEFEWIAFLDGDDLWLENHLKECLEMMKSYPNEKFFSTSFKYSDNRKMYRHKRASKIFKVGNYFNESLRESLICIGTAVINKSCFQTVGLYNTNLKTGEDLDLWNRLARNYNLIKCSEVTTIYRVEAENRTTLSKDLETNYEYNLELNKYLNNDELIYFKEMIANRLYQYARNKDLYNFKKLKKKHASVSYTMVIKYSAKYIIHRAFEKAFAKNNQT